MEISFIVIILVVGLFAGILGGSLGIGGGIVIIPALIFILGYSVHVAQGTMLAMMVPPVGYTAFISYYKKKLINLKAAYVLMFVFVIASYFGSKFALILPEIVMRKAFGVMIIAVGIKMLLQKKKKN